MKFVTLAIVVVLIAGCGATGNPTAREILNGNPDADIIKLDGLVYSPTLNAELNPGKGYTKGDEIGKVNKRTTNTFFGYGNLYASKLPEGTRVYSTEKTYEKGDAPFVILVKIDGELIDYHALVEV